MNVKRLYGYSVKDLATAIVIADSVEEAREKVKTAYNAHSNEFNAKTDWIEIWKLDENSWFEDHPDVLEVLDY